MKKSLIIIGIFVTLFSSCTKKVVEEADTTALEARIYNLEEELAVYHQFPAYTEEQRVVLKEKDKELEREIAELDIILDDLETRSNTTENIVTYNLTKVFSLERRIERIEFLIETQLVSIEELSEILEDFKRKRIRSK